MGNFACRAGRSQRHIGCVPEQKARQAERERQEQGSLPAVPAVAQQRNGQKQKERRAGDPDRGVELSDIHPAIPRSCVALLKGQNCRRTGS